MTQTTVTNSDDLWTAVQSASPGDEFLLAPGEYAKIVFYQNHFDPPIHIASADKSSRALVNLIELEGPSGFHFLDLDVAVRGAWDYGLKIWSAKDIVMSGIHVRGMGDVREGQGANISDSQGVLLTECEIEGVGSGILGNGSTDVTISDNALHDLRTDCIFLGGFHDSTVARNDISDMFPEPGDHCDAIQLSADTRTWVRGSGISVVDNDIRRGDGAQLQGVFVEDNDDMLVAGNAMCGTMTNGIALQRTVGGLIDSNFVQGFEDCWSKIYVTGATGVTVTANSANHTEGGTGNTEVTIGDDNVVIPLAALGDYSAMDAWRAEHPPGGGPSPPDPGPDPDPKPPLHLDIDADVDVDMDVDIERGARPEPPEEKPE